MSIEKLVQKSRQTAEIVWRAGRLFGFPDGGSPLDRGQ